MPRDYSVPPRSHTAAQIDTQKAAGLSRRSRRRGKELRESFGFNAMSAFIAGETGTEFKPYDVNDWGYDYEEVNKDVEIGGAYGKYRMTVERDQKTGFFNITTAA